MLISIIVATYNAEKTLQRCLDSIIPQLSDQVELIIIDGESEDSTNEIIASYGDKISYTISEPDKGIYDAWNKGIKVANGKWVAFIGADDILLPDALDVYLKVIKETNSIDMYDYICARNEYVDKDGNIIKIMGNKPDWTIFRKRMNAAHVASLHHKQNLFEQIGHYDLSFKICADYELLMRKKENLRCIYLTNHIAQMQMGGMSFSTDAIIETYRIRRKHTSVSYLRNILLIISDWLMFKSFIMRKRIKGCSLKMRE